MWDEMRCGGHLRKYNLRHSPVVSNMPGVLSALQYRHWVAQQPNLRGRWGGQLSIILMVIIEPWGLGSWEGRVSQGSGDQDLRAFLPKLQEKLLSTSWDP